MLIQAAHGIPARNIVAHSDIAPDRKEDPGERFDWRSLAENGVGPVAVRRAIDLGTTGIVRDAASLRPVRAALQEIGYRVGPRRRPWTQPCPAVLRAFQRHWRPEAVTGQADDGTLVRLLAVRELVRGG